MAFTAGVGWALLPVRLWLSHALAPAPLMAVVVLKTGRAGVPILQMNEVAQ